MTDYRKKLRKVADPKKEKFFKRNRIHKINESTNNLESKNLETESLVNSMHKFENTFRPECTARDPSTFAFYGSAEKYYDSAFYNIANYYPFDGTNEQLINWYQESSPLEFSLLKDHWPGTTGHVNFTNSQYINFYGGPQTLTSFENVGQFRDNETPLRLDATKGNTAEFWLKKSTFSVSNHQEVVFEIGTYPGQIASAHSGKFRLYLSASDGSPFYVDYTSGSVGVTAKNLDSSLTTGSMVDDKWHHYALSVKRGSGELEFKLYVDGTFNSSTKQSVAAMGPVDTFMAGTIGANNASTDGSLSGSLDEFRFWKGFRNARDVGKYFDKRVYASDISNTDYASRLGVYYRFNKDPLGVNSKDKMIVDFSGNQVIGQTANYSAAFRGSESAITVSDKTQNVELLDPILTLENPKLITKIFDFEELGKSYDNQNINMLSKNVPEWVYDANREGSANQESEVALLLHLMSTEFDLTKINLDSILKNSGPQNQEPSGLVEDVGRLPTDNTRYIQDEPSGCSDSLILDRVTPGNLIDMSLLKIEGSNVEVEILPLVHATIEEENENLIFPFRLEKSIPEVRRAILSNIESTLASMLQRKGTESAFDSILRSYGIDRDIVSYNILGRNTDILVEDTKLDLISEKKNSVFLGQNPSATIFLSGSQSDERTFIQASTEEMDYTFEGTFMFPPNVGTTHNVIDASIFGLAEVPASNNSFQFQSPNNADFQVKVTKLSLDRDDASFSLSSDSSIISTLESPVFKDVYKNSRWSLSLKIEKDLDNKFISSSSPSTLGYKAVFSGYNYILDNLQNSFVLSASLNSTKYVNFNNSNKTFYVGAQRTNVTGAVQTKSDIKIVSFSAWSDELSEKELKFKAQAPSVSGRSSHFLGKDNFSTKNASMSDNLIAELQFANVTDLSTTNDITILDASSGSISQISRYGQIVGYKYPAKSTTFSNKTGSVIQQEFLPVVRSVPLINVHGTQGVTIKNSEIDRFTLSARPESKLFSFEKSMYQAISREMLLFLSGLGSFNNLIGEPVNKYRKNYKMIDHLRQKFYELVENESQFERYVQYYRWIDASIGSFLRQLVPATSDANTGIENVVESHALERNKYQHKYINMEQKVPDLSTNLLAINELLYDWEHGHVETSELNHCLWQKDRKERSGTRETLRKVLTTKVSGSTYVLRNLVKPYKNSIDIQKTLNIGSNKSANNIPNLYKVVNQGKNIVINSEDIYEFKGCSDIIVPNKKKRYTAKTNTTLTSGYIDADADLILPFSLYSSSAGTTFENFKQNLVITNNHDDIPALQGSFVRKFVGGYPHRNVEIGTAGPERPEAYQIDSTNSSLTIKQATGPKSMFLRSVGGDQFYHIGNIKTQTNPLVIGNYRKDYEIVLTNGRTANNNYLVENEGRNLTSSFTAASLVSGMVDFLVPERPARDHVIVNRFSSPGSPEADSAFGRDREAGEYSVYDTLNYRNLTVRSVFNTLNVERSERFGLRSGSSTQASIHKTNRNPLRFTSSLGKEVIFDNSFVQHHIPQNDFGYSWVTASANEKVHSFLKKHGNVGHQHKFKISGSLRSSETINFVSASELVPDLHFARGNFYVTAAVDTANNLITYTDTALNSQLLNNHGPYGWPSWRQIRSLYNPIVRKHREDNTLSAVFTGKKPFTSAKRGSTFDYQNSVTNDNDIFVPRTTKNFKEIMVTSKFKPLVVSVHPVASQAAVELLREIPFRNTLSDIDVFDQAQMEEMWNNDQFYQNILSEQMQDAVTEGERRMLTAGPNGISATPVFSMKTSVQSKISDFANQEMSDEFNHEESRFLEHKNLQILNKFISDTQGFAPIREMNYVETIYPKETNTYTKNARTRENFKFFGWDSVRTNRNLILSGNVTYQDFIYKSAEHRMFPISVASRKEVEFRQAYFDNIEIIDLNSTGSSASISNSKHITGSNWVLDSRQTFTQKPADIVNSFFNDGDSFLAARDQGTRGEGILQNDFSIFGLGYNGLRGRTPFAPLYNRRIPQAYGSNVYLAGEAKFESADDTVGPFYDDYNTYAENARLMGQNYSVIPEFRISQFIEDIYEDKFSEDSLKRDDFLQLTGAIYHSSSGDLSIGTQFFKTYSTSDFMKYFGDARKNVNENNFDFTEGRLTLKCAGIKRFLPYRGLYPAERLVQISEIFHRGYLSDDSYDHDYIVNSGISETLANSYMNLRIENSKAQALKPLMAPGVLFNSVKAGLAVDYPIFSSSLGSAVDHITGSFITSSLNDFSVLSLGASTSFTGSLVNSTLDSGVPRISGSVSRRVDFQDVLEPERLFKEVMYDNEPHPSASLLYGPAKLTKVLERPSKFGILDQTATKRDIAVNFGIEGLSFANSMLAYKSAVNNFCAETVNFFLEDQKLQTVLSEPVKPYMQKGVNYKMRIYINNEQVSMYDRHSAFGPPVDEGDVEITRFSLKDTTIQGAAATGSVSFGSYTGTESNMFGNTITITDTANSGVTYQFVTNSIPVAATASINFANTARVSLAEDILGVTSSAGDDAEFQFKQEQIGTTASCIIDINDNPGDNASVFEQLGQTMDLSDYDFTDNDTIVLLNSVSSSADVWLDLPLKNFMYTQGNTSNTTGSARQIVFLNPTDYSLARYKIAFRSGKEPFMSGLAQVLSGSVLNKTASLTFKAEDLEQNFHFYTSDNSQYLGGAPRAQSNSYRIDVNNKTANQIALTMANVLNTEAATSDADGEKIGIGKYLFAKNAASSADNENIVNVFARRRSHELVEAGQGVGILYHIQASSSNVNAYFGSWPHPNTETIPTTGAMSSNLICQITTGSGNNRPGAWSIGSKFVTDKYESFAREYMNDAGISGPSFREQSQYKWSVYTQRTNDNLPTDSGTAKPFRFVSASYTGATPASLSFQFEDHIINNFSSSYGDNLSGSSFGNKVFSLNFAESGSAFNQVPTSTSSIGPTALGAGSSDMISTNSNQHFFTGGQTEIDFTSGQIVGGKRIIPIPQSANISQIVQSVSSSFNVVFGQQMGVFINGAGTLLSLTQSASDGVGGNTTIHQSGFIAGDIDDGAISQASGYLGFAGGITGLYHTNGSAIGGGNTNKAVLIGDSTASGISGSSVVRNNFLSAVVANQDSTVLAQSVSDATLGPVPNVTLTQRVSGAAGNRTISDSGFSTIANDVRGFAGGVDFVEGTIKMAPTTLIESSSHGHLPYVPPFLDPNTRPYVELSIIPAESKKYTIPEIIENLTSSYYNISAPSNAGTNTNYKESMAISASLDFKKYVKLQSDNLVSIGGVLQPSDPRDSDKYRWVIQPKWETPVLDFSNVTSSALDLSSNSVQQVTGSPWKPRSQSNYYEILNVSSKPYLTSSTGMWHQSGNVIDGKDSKGYHIVIEPSSHDLANNVGDLASTCGFMDRDDRRRILSGYNNLNSYKLGKLAETKRVSEAVVAIPYFLTDDCEMQFFPLRFSSLDDARQLNASNESRLQTEIYAATTPEEASVAREKYEDWRNTPGQDAAANIAYQLRMMDKYVMPPHFDFEKFPNLATPHVAYCFQFQSELTQKDLANIWQNMYPTSGSAGKALKSETKYDDKSTDVQYISGYLNTDQISMFASRTSNYQDPEEFLEKEVRWLVFKVKMRAETFYKDLTSRSITDNRLDIVSINDVEVGSRKETKGSDAEFRDIFGKFGYNWPYDFFSIVELIKLDGKVDFYESGEGAPVTSILRQEQGQNSEPQQFTRVANGAGSSTATTSAFTAAAAQGAFSSADVASSMVIRETLKADDAALPSPANRYTASTSTIRANTEQLYINGVLMSHGASNDYTISGNVVTLTFNPNSSDSIVITYIKG
jgi:hypothetical protein